MYRKNAFYSISRRGHLILAIFFGKRKNWLVKLKKLSQKNNDFAVTKELDKVIRFLAFYCREKRISAITVPPSSGIGINWIGKIAGEVAKKGNVKYIKAFGAHSLGKRYLQYLKYKKINYKRKNKLTGQNVLLLDDFAYTGNTMVGAIEKLEKRNKITAIVLGA